MFCSNCGKPIEDDAGFCPSCGTAVEPQEMMEVANDVQAVNKIPVAPAPQVEDQAVQQAQQMPQGSYCFGCGTFIEDEQQFCPKCGTAKNGVKKVKSESEIVLLVKKMLRTPVDGFAALYSCKNTRIPAIFVGVQAILAIIYGLLLENKLVSSYNAYLENLTVNLTNTLTSILGEFLGGIAGVGGGLAGGVSAGFAGELIEDVFGDSINVTIINALQFKSDLIGIGAIILVSVIAIAAQVLILFLLMQIFKIKVVFMDAVKIYAAKSFWSALCILIATVLVFVSPWSAIGFILIAGIFVNHSVGQMLVIHSPESKNQIFWIQMIFNVIEVLTVALSIYYISGVVVNNFIRYLGGIIPFLEEIL